MQKKQMAVRRIVMNAVMIGVYFVLTRIVIPVQLPMVGSLKFTFEHFPVVLCAVLFGPADAVLVGGIGEFFDQLFSAYGLTPTTALWILPIVFRGCFVGLFAKIFKKRMGSAAILEKKVPVVFLTVCILSGLLSSCLNTFAHYVDAKLFGYYTYTLVFGLFSVKLVVSAITSVIICLSTKAVMYALYREHLI